MTDREIPLPGVWRRVHRSDITQQESKIEDSPYVGPRPFEARDRSRFFGRIQETQTLVSLVVTRPAVVLYAPSAAGKTSLLQASLIPQLEEKEQFYILPLSRVGGELPPSVDPKKVKNLYVFNLLLNMAEAKATYQDLTSVTLREGLAQYFARQPERPALLILDQLEELFTLNPRRHKERVDFFEQLRVCLLKDFPQMSLLLVLREDYVAQLDAFAHQMPDRLRTRFRVERLGYHAALTAIKEPARLAGRPFENGVAESLAANLAGLDNTSWESKQDFQSPGVYIEPMHLQIVCKKLWDRLPPTRKSIKSKDVKAFGDVDQALIAFYEDALEDVIRRTDVEEGQVRAWFSSKLITQADTRGLVYSDETKKETQGLPNAAVDLLYEAYLIRPYKRGKDTFYELAHDRLVGPILASNRAWEIKRLKHPVTIVSFEVDRSAIIEGQEINLAWEVEGADSVQLKPLSGDLALQHKVTLKPKRTTEYTLQAVKNGKVATEQSLRIFVGEQFGQRWEVIVYNIKDEKLTPLISRSILYGQLFGYEESLAQRWAEVEGHTWTDKPDLIQVANLVELKKISDPRGIRQEFLFYLEEVLTSRIEESENGQGASITQNMSLQALLKQLYKIETERNLYEDPFSILAELPVSIYVTTDYHQQLEQSLMDVDKNPITDFCRWHYGLADYPSPWNDINFVPEPDTPVVYHFHGLDEIPDSLVLTEEDHVLFLANVLADHDLVPIEVKKQLATSSLLALGYDWQGWEFRSLLQGVISPLSRRRWRENSIFQTVEPLDEQALQFIYKYLGRYNFEVYWGDWRAFLLELKARWAELP